MTRWLYLPGWACRLLNKPVKHAANPHWLRAAHRHYRRAQRFKRAAWVCIAVGTGTGVAVVPRLFQSPPPLPSPPAVTTSGNALPERQWAIPSAATGTPSSWPIIGPPVLLPDVPAAEAPTTPLSVPEPSSLALLATAVAAMLIANRR